MNHLSITSKLLCLSFCLLWSSVTFAQLPQANKSAVKKQASTAVNQTNPLNQTLNESVRNKIKSKTFKSFSVAAPPPISSPTSPSASPASICVGSNVSLTATCSTGTVMWYNQATGGTSIGTGSPLTQSPTVTTTYYASCYAGGAPTRVMVGGESSRVSAGTVTVTGIPADPTSVSVDHTTICSGASILLSATCSAGTVTWYNQASGGTAIGTGSGLSQSPIASTIYYASCKSGSCESSRVVSGEVTIVSLTTPTGVSVNKMSIVNGAKVTLSATCSSGNVVWYNQQSGGSDIGGGTSIGYYPTKNTTFYATCRNGICETSRVATNAVSVINMSRLPYMVSDNINPGETSSELDELTNVNGTLFFITENPAYGRELWKTDGTVEGTMLVKDINPGPDPSYINSLKKVGNLLFFAASDGIHGNELWISNGEADGTVMVKDIITGITNTEIGSITDVNGIAYFTVNDETTVGKELWKSDGTANGTVLLKDILPGVDSSDPNNLLNVNGTLFFTAIGAGTGRELWKSDGSTEGTVIVKDIRSGTNQSSSPENLINANGAVYFVANDGTNGKELWRSDGSPDGTTLVKDITAGSGSTTISYITSIDDISYMVAQTSNYGQELWRSDGTSGGTYQVKDIYAGTSSSNINSLVNRNGILYFGANDGISGYELWRSKGTEDSTYLVKDIWEGTEGSLNTNPIHVEGILYFVADNGINGSMLWKSDGTADGTEQVRNTNTEFSASVPEILTGVNGKLYFKSSLSGVTNYGTELWSVGTCTDANKMVTTSGKTDYFNSQPQPTSDTLTCHCDMFNKLITTIKATGDNPLSNGLVVREWIDETASEAYVRRHYEIDNPDDMVSAATGTGRITLYFTQADFDAYNSEVSSVAPKLPANSDDDAGKANLGIVRYSGTSGDETGQPGAYSGVAASINPKNSDIVWNITLERWEVTFATVGLGGYFVKGLDLQDPTEVAVNTTMICEGSSVSLTATCAAGTVAWYNQASGGSAIGTGSPLVISLGTTTIYYAACEEDGYSGSRVATQEVVVNPMPAVPTYVAVSSAAILYGNKVSLYATCATGSVTWYNQLSGGAAIGTGYGLNYYPGSTVTYYASCKIGACESTKVATGEVVVTPTELVPYMIKNIYATLGEGSNPNMFMAINGSLFFMASDGGGERRLWKTDGTEQGTQKINGISSGFIDNLTNVNGTLYFSVQAQNYYELWKSDGSDAGTVKIKDVWPHSGPNSVKSFRALNNTLYFVNSNQTTNVTELWKSDGSSGGTIKVMDINESLTFFRGDELVAVNNNLFFLANTTAYGTELWKTDGTKQEMVKDIREGTSSSSALYLTNVNGTLFFSAFDNSNGFELWKSDGTTDGTVMVKNIRAGLPSSNPNKLTNINGKLYFRATNGTKGFELWTSDGTDAGTVMVKDIADGADNSDPEYITAVNGTVYFAATTTDNNKELWKTDGTSGGTTLVKDIYPGSESSGLTNLTNVNGKLYFTADNGQNGPELWTSDGTGAGTVMVKDIYAGSDGSSPNFLTVMNGKLYYTATTMFDSISYGTELWSLGSCTSNNAIVNNLNKTSYYNSQVQPDASALTCHCSVFNDLISTIEATGANQVSGVVDAKEWIDSTASEEYVRRHYEINPATNATTATGKVTLYFTEGDFNAYYAADTARMFKLPLDHCDINGIKNIRILKRSGMSSDDTGVPETYSGEVTMIDPEEEDIFWSDANQRWVVSFTTTGFGGFFVRSAILTNPTEVSVNSTAICVGTSISLTASCAGETVLWYNQATGGSAIGTGTVLSQSPNVSTTYYAACQVNTTESNRILAGQVTVEPFPVAPTGISVNKTTVEDGSSVILTATCSVGTPIWYGLASGGVVLGTGTSFSHYPIANTTYYVACTSNGICESTRMLAGTVKVLPLVPYLVKNVTVSADALKKPIHYKGNVYFAGNDGINGEELWKSDGTEAGTVMLKNININAESATPQYFTIVDDILYFSAIDATHGRELWKTDGTEVGTVLVKDIKPGANESYIQHLINVNGTLYLKADNGVNGTELWKTNGTEAGTVMVKDINPGMTGSSIGYMAVLRDTLYFRAVDGVHAEELWKSDGTEAGTRMVKDINTSGPGYIVDLINVNGILFFRGFARSEEGMELWKSDGTANGTVLLKNINPTGDSFPGNFTNVNGTLFFTADNGTNGVELWKSDGTTNGTTLVKDIQTGISGGEIASLSNINGLLYFRANNGTNGSEMWKSNGTEAGTVMVKDINTGGGGAGPGNFTLMNGNIYFGANNGTNGIELWTTDGTADGTYMLKEINPSGNSASPDYLTNINGKLYFQASTVFDNASMASKLWSLGTCTEANTLVSKTGQSLTFTSQKQLSADSLTCHCNVFNHLISTTKPSGINPANGSIAAREWLETTAPTTFVKRHFEINPVNVDPTLTGTITLYFNQADFNAYNVAVGSNTFKLPTGSSDNTGISNLLIEKRTGSASDTTGLPGTYSGAVTSINPEDTDVVWNNTLNRWEVTFATTGFGGFFIKSPVLPAPTSASVSLTAICSGTSVALTATCGTGTILWYNQATGGSSIGTSSPLSQSPTTNTTYYAACTDGTYISNRVTTNQVIVTTMPVNPTSVSINNTIICAGDAVSLTASCSIGTITWYNEATGGTAIGTGNAFSQSPSVASTYYASCKNGTCESSRVATNQVIVTTMPVNPTSVVVNNTIICAGDAVSLTASCSIGTITWYNEATGGTSIGTGNAFSQSPSVASTYYASCKNGTCESSRVATNEITIKTKPGTPVINGNTEICAGSNVILTATMPDVLFSASDFHWTGGRTGGTLNLTPSVTTSYSVLANYNGCNSDSSAIFMVYVTPTPEVPVITADNATLCKGNSALLTGQCPGLSDSFFWSVAQLRPNTPISPNNERTRIVSEPGTYKGYCQTFNGCKSSESSITITQDSDCNGQNFIKVTPEKPVICPNTSVTLSATGCSGTLTWTIGTSTRTGTAVTVSPSATTTYFVQCSTGGSTTVDVAVAATSVVVNANVTTGISQIKAVNTIESAKKIGSPTYSPSPNVAMEAGKSIVFNPGFVVEAGSVFKAEIKGCN